MGRPPTHGAPSFRFFPAEVAQMEALLREHGGHVPAREVLMALADSFSNSSERSGKITVQMKQVWNWFQNRRYALRSKLVKAPGNPNMPPNPEAEVTPVRNVPSVPQQTIAPSPSGHNVAKNTTENPLMEFEAKSARDGAWYDVQAFHSHRYLETGNPEVLIRFSGFGPEEDEWVNVRKHVRQRSLPCESSECVAVLPGDLILCFQEGKEQALYFDAHVLDAQRRRHDVRGCRCRFLVRYDHDQSEEIVPLRKVCRRPETDYRLQVLHAANESESASASASVSADSKKAVVDPASSSSLKATSHNPSAFVGVSAPTIMSAGAGGPHPTTTATPVPTVAPAPTPATGPALASIPSPAPTSNSVSTPAPALANALASTSVPAPALDSTSVAVSAEAERAPALNSTSIATLAAASAPALAPDLAQAPAPALIPAPTLSPDPAVASSSIPISAPNSSPSLICASTLSPSLACDPSPSVSATAIPISVPDSASAPPPDPVLVPTPAPVLFSIPAAAPELKKTKSGNSGTSATEASAENIINPGAASEIVEVKKEEGQNLESSMFAGSSISQGETSDNPTITIPGSEKPGVIEPIEQAMAVSTATTGSSPIVSSLSTKAESSNQAVSVEDTKE